ncbi:MAG: hypothetical protein AAF483_09235 [Planctomycetota bacterium]
MTQSFLLPTISSCFLSFLGEPPFLGGSAREASGQAFLLVKDFERAGGPFDCCKEKPIWTSEAVEISEPGEFLCSADIECIEFGEFEQDDFIKFSYRIDNGDWAELFDLQSDFKRAIFSVHTLGKNASDYQILIL